MAEVGGVLRARHLCRDVLLITVRTAAALTAQAAVAGAGLEAWLVTRLHPGETHAAIMIMIMIMIMIIMRVMFNDIGIGRHRI